MLTLASMIWAAFLTVQSDFRQHNAPPPVVIETGETYNYIEIESAIYVPSNWNDNCYNQQQVIYYMAKHFNGFRNGNNKFSEDKLIQEAHKWKCLTDDMK